MRIFGLEGIAENLGLLLPEKGPQHPRRRHHRPVSLQREQRNTDQMIEESRRQAIQKIGENVRPIVD